MTFELSEIVGAKIKGQGALIRKHPTMLCDLVATAYIFYTTGLGEGSCWAELCALLQHCRALAEFIL